MFKYSAEKWRNCFSHEHEHAPLTTFRGERRQADDHINKYIIINHKKGFEENIVVRASVSAISGLDRSQPGERRDESILSRRNRMSKSKGWQKLADDQSSLRIVNTSLLNKFKKKYIN